MTDRRSWLDRLVAACLALLLAAAAAYVAVRLIQAIWFTLLVIVGVVLVVGAVVAAIRDRSRGW